MSGGGRLKKPRHMLGYSTVEKADEEEEQKEQEQEELLQCKT
jgi:hypothetical protein